MTAHLGTTGMPGVKAWVGLFKEKPTSKKEGKETVVVFVGAVGGVVGQLAKIKAAR